MLNRLLLIGIFWQAWVLAFAQPTAVDSLRLIAQAGDYDARIKLSEMYRLGYSGVVANDDSANFYLRLAAQSNNPEALYLLGVANMRGLGMQKNITAGIKNLESAANSNHKLAILELISIYSHVNTMFEENKHTTYNPTKAIFWAKKGTSLKSGTAAFYYANALLVGNGTARNDSLALLVMDTAATICNFVDAQIVLADWYFYGKTKLGANLPKAAKYYQLALDNPKKDIDQETAARIGLHYCVQYRRLANNVLWMIALPDSRTAPQLTYKP